MIQEIDHRYTPQEVATTLDQPAFKELGITGIFYVNAKHIEGTEMCQVMLPCKYKNKALTIVVYE